MFVFLSFFSAGNRLQLVNMSIPRSVHYPLGKFYRYYILLVDVFPLLRVRVQCLYRKHGDTKIERSKLLFKLHPFSKYRVFSNLCGQLKFYYCYYKR